MNGEVSNAEFATFSLMYFRIALKGQNITAQGRAQRPPWD